MLTSWTLTRKIILLFFALGVVQFACAVMIFMISQQQEAAERRATVAKIEQSFVSHSNQLVYAVVMESRGIYIAANWAAATGFSNNLLGFAKELGSTIRKLSPDTLPEASEAIKRTTTSVDHFVEFRKELVRLAQHESITAARDFGDNDANRSARQALNKDLQELAERFRNYADTTMQSAEYWRGWMRHIIVMAGLIPFAGVLIGWFIATRELSRPINSLKNCISAMAAGDLRNAVFGAERRDEIGEIAGAIQKFKEQLLAAGKVQADADAEREIQEENQRLARQGAIAQERALILNSVGVGLAMIAEKNLAYRMTEELPAVYRKLQADFNSAIEQLGVALSGVRRSADAIGAGTSEIATASDDLSRRTEQQAASLEETAVALDEITATVNKTADTAKQAREVVAIARNDANHGSDVVMQAVDAMGKIERSSRQITQIIGVIEEIAFQTNLLALNAGVEAARAGDAGRGFAVVASEVRALAQRSADAAKEIKTLISVSAAEVGEGVKLVAETGRSLERIAGKVSDINHAVAEIATSAQEQATSLQQVNIAVNHMDHVTQQNAAMAEESTAASRSLALETEQLSRMVMEFSFTPTTTATDGLRTELQRVVPHAFASSQPPAAKPERAGSVGPGGNIKSIGDGKLRRVASAGKVVTWEEF